MTRLATLHDWGITTLPEYLVLISLPVIVYLVLDWLSAPPR